MQCTPSINLDSAGDDQDIIITQDHDQKYTVDDMFCGCGGVSCAVQREGFHISLACDSDSAACESYRKNFPSASLKQMNISDLSEELKNSTEHVDILRK